MAGHASFDSVISTTMKKYAPRIEDNIFSNLPLLYFLNEADHIDRVPGGEQLVEPLMYATNSTAGSYAGYDNIATTPQEGISAAVFDWKQYAATVAISGIEEAKNSGDSAVVSLLEAKVQQAEMSIEETLNAMLYLDGTGNSSKDFAGLAAYIRTDGQGSSVGGIDATASDNSWWRNYTSNAAAVLTISRLATAYNTVSRGKDHPEFILTDQDEYQAYEALLQPQLRFSDPKTADAGFENLLYKSAPIMYDADCQAGYLYLLNSKYLRLKVHSDVWFKPTPFEKPHGQDARYSQILCYGNLVVSNRARLGLIYGLTD
jgi:hypothetical protein